MKENKPCVPPSSSKPIFKLVFNKLALHQLSLFLCFLTDCALWFHGFMDLQHASTGLQKAVSFVKLMDSLQIYLWLVFHVVTHFER